MYAPFFGLARVPFSIAPDPRFLYLGARHREALAHLLYGLRAGGGFVVLSGDIGAGKTTVTRAFVESVPADCLVAYVFNPRLTVAELLRTVCEEFGALPRDAAPSPGGKACVDALNRFLLALHAQGRQAVLVVDEAQDLGVALLEQLRLLTNLETTEKKLLQIVLVGQPELREMLAQPGLEQLAQRIVARCHLGPLTREETPRYVRHRLAVAGAVGPVPFDDAALARLHALAGGVPRRINLLADRALLGAYAQGRRQVDRATVERAAREVFDGTGAPARPPWQRHARQWLPWAALAGGAVAASVALLGQLDRGPLGAAPAASLPPPAANAAPLRPTATAAPGGG